MLEFSMTPLDNRFVFLYPFATGMKLCMLVVVFLVFYILSNLSFLYKTFLFTIYLKLTVMKMFLPTTWNVSPVQSLFPTVCFFVFVF